MGLAAALTWLALGAGQAADAPKAKAFDVSRETVLELQLADEMYARAATEAEAAAVRREKALGLFREAILKARIALGLGDEYRWEDQLRKFVLIEKPAEKKEP